MHSQPGDDARAGPFVFSAAAFLILWSRSEPTPATFVSFQSIFSGFCMVARAAAKGEGAGVRGASLAWRWRFKPALRLQVATRSAQPGIVANPSFT